MKNSSGLASIPQIRDQMQKQSNDFYNFQLHMITILNSGRKLICESFAIKQRFNMLRLSASISALLSASALAQPAFAEEALDLEAYDDSRTIIVTGLSEGYLATNSVTATKTDNQRGHARPAG
jgi:hypothetical protein